MTRFAQDLVFGPDGNLLVLYDSPQQIDRFKCLAQWVTLDVVYSKRGDLPLSVFSRTKLTSGNIRASDHIASQLIRVFSHPESANVIGQEYLRLWPEEANTTFLIQRIFSCSSDELLGCGTMEPLRAMIGAQILTDFERHRVLAVHGWLFSQTELRLCALAALVSRQMRTNQDAGAS
jgi:hypothetical protein